MFSCKRLIRYIFEYIENWAIEVVIPLLFEVLAIFQRAACIVTDTIHGSVFSLKYTKNFCTIVRGMNNNKLSHLLEQFGLEKRIVKTPDMLEKILSTPIDYTPVNEQLVKERERSLVYLKEHFHYCPVKTGI